MPANRSLQRTLSVVLTIICCLSVSDTANGQKTAEFDAISPGYASDLNTAPPKFSYLTSDLAFFSRVDAEDTVADILEAVGLTASNFQVAPGDPELVPSAAAAIRGTQRFLLYNPNFIRHIKDATGSRWAGVSIMAHEIAHHIEGHTIGRQMGASLELEADRWSGFTLQRMGASLREAQLVIDLVGSDVPSSTHPAGSERLEAIEEGWNGAYNRYGAPRSESVSDGDDRVDFGDDSGFYPNDGECDDGRFEGEGMGVTSQVRGDATDCRALYREGRVQLVEVVDDPPDIDFGDDSGRFPNDGECDDGRFEGEGMGVTSQVRGDATDCRALYREGRVQLVEVVDPPDIDFGDDSGRFPNDGECDDGRFEGEGMGVTSQVRGDATDCRALYREGRVQLVEVVDPPDIDFGDDSGRFPNDGECDDGRFEGEGMGVTSQVRGDATDCRALYREGRVQLVEVVDPPDIDFGDDSGRFPNDGECDDGRFEGEGMGVTSQVRGDATDCRALYREGRVQLVEVVDPPDIDFGDDSGRFPNDGECDDGRFEGEGMGVTSQVRGDATDCRALYREGRVQLVSLPVVESPFGSDSWLSGNGECDDARFEGKRMGIPWEVGTDATDCRRLLEEGRIQWRDDRFDLGDDSSIFANDGECDDGRFGGDGVGITDFGILQDATDCQRLLRMGRIRWRFPPPK